MMTHAVDRQIKSELIQLAGFYGTAEHSVRDVLEKLNLAPYAEIVLGQTGFEVVVGGVGRESQLIALAGDMNFPPPVVEAFERCAARFSAKMLYTKVPLGLSPHPSMYFCVIEPWEPVFEILETLPGIKPALPALQRQIASSPICFLLGFTLDGRSGDLVVKTYYLMDRQGPPANSPALLSHRLSSGELSSAVKTYTMGVGWKDFEISDSWRKLATFSQSIYGDHYALMKGYSQSPAGEEIKLYVFRNDLREDLSYQLSTYNYYYDEGIRLLHLQRYVDAINSFTNAIAFQPDHAHAYNNRGFCYIQLNDWNRALPDCQKALALDPQISGNNLNYVRQQWHAGIL